MFGFRKTQNENSKRNCIESVDWAQEGAWTLTKKCNQIIVVLIVVPFEATCLGCCFNKQQGVTLASFCETIFMPVELNAENIY